MIAIPFLLAGSVAAGDGAPVRLRAGETRTLDAGTDDVPVWNQVALQGDYKGHPQGSFALNAKTFGEIVDNFRTHPSYAKDATGVGCADVIAWDFHHASEGPASAIADRGAPAQGWVQELEIRKGPKGLELWALTRWLDTARTYIRTGAYKWASISFWPNSKDGKTGRTIGTYLSSIALTNDPFIQGMQPLAAERTGLPATPTPAARAASPDRRHAMKLAARLASIYGLSTAIVLEAREEDPASVAKLEGAVVNAAEDKMKECQMLAAKLYSLLGGLGMKPEEATEGVVASRIAALVKTESEHKANASKLLELERIAAEAAVRDNEGAVDAVIATYGMGAEVRPALLHYRRTAKDAFEKEYPIVASTPQAAHTFGNLLRPMVTQPTGASPLGAITLGRDGSLNFGAAPAGPVAFGGQSHNGNAEKAKLAAEISQHEGPNSYAKTMAYLASKNPNVRQNYDELHARAGEMLTSIRQAGVQI